MTATQPVEAPRTGRLATQSVEAPSARTATQPVEAPCARPEVHSQPTGTSSLDVSAVDQFLTSKKTVAATTTGVSDSDDELQSELGSPAGGSDRDDL